MSNTNKNVHFGDDVVDLTATNSNKRKKTTKKIEVNSSTTISPSEKSLSLVLAHLASHPLPIIDLGTTLYKKFAKCMKLRDDLYRRKRKLDPSTDYISKSMKHNFILYGPDSLKSSQEFKTLNEECNTAIASMQKILKEKSLKVVELELKELKDNIRTLFCESIQLLATALIKNNPEYKEDPSIRNLIIAVFEKEYTENVLPHESMSQINRITDYDDPETDEVEQERYNGAATLSSQYSKLLFFSEIPSKLLKRADLQSFFDYFFLKIKNMTGYIVQETYTAGADAGDNFNAAISYLGTLDVTLTNLIKCIFFDSRVEYQVQQQQNSRTAKLKTWVSTALDERATETTSMDIDNVNLNSIEMKALIDERAQIKINQVAKKFDNKMKQMENQLKQSKNDRRETANSRSKTKSKNNNNNNKPTGGGQRTRQKKKEKGQKAEDANNASGNDKKNNRNKNSKGNGKKNKKK